MSLVLMVGAGQDDVKLLGADAFKVREAAAVRLARSPKILAFLVGEQSGDPEVSRRCRLMANAWFCRHAKEIAEHARPKEGWPRIDCGQLVFWPALSDEQRQNAEYCVLNSLTDQLIRTRSATQWKVIDLIAARGEWREFLDRMIEFEKVLSKR